MESEALRWLEIAEDDLLSARGLIDLNIYSTSVYHIQQSFEKSLKAYLAFKFQPIPKSHNLYMLTNICLSFDSSFSEFCEPALQINPYGVNFRYPSDELEPSLNEIVNALKIAEELFLFVKSKIN